MKYRSNLVRGPGGKGKKVESVDTDDGVLLLTVACDKCGEQYGECLLVAQRLVRSGLHFLCIRCDPLANVSSGVRITAFGASIASQM